MKTPRQERLRNNRRNANKDWMTEEMIDLKKNRTKREMLNKLNSYQQMCKK